MAKKKTQIGADGADPAAAVDTGERKSFETLEGLKDEISQSLEGAASEGTAKGKRGPYKKKDKATKQQEQQAQDALLAFDAAMLEQGLAMAFGFLAARAGQHWLLSEQEAKSGAAVVDAVLQKYLPVLGPYMVELNLLLWGGMVIGPRMLISKQLSDQRAAAARPTDPVELATVKNV